MLQDEQNSSKECKEQIKNYGFKQPNTIQDLSNLKYDKSKNICDMSFIEKIQPQYLTEDQGVIKYQIQQGKLPKYEKSSPLDGARIKFFYDGRQQNGEPIDKYRNVEEIRKIKLGDEKILKGFNIALRSMLENEISWFKFEPQYHYYQIFNDKSQEQQQEILAQREQLVQKNQPLFYKIEVIEYSNLKLIKDPNNFDQRIELLQMYREKGNDLFKEGKLDLAFKEYQQGTFLLKQFPRQLKKNFNEQQQSIYDEFITILNGNACQCKIKTEKWNEALDFVNEALQGNPQHLKNLHRKAQCLFKTKGYEDAYAIWKQLLEQDPQNSLIFQKHIQECQQQINKNKLTEPQKYKKIFEQLAEEEEKEKIMEKMKQLQIQNQDQEIQEKIQLQKLKEQCEKEMNLEQYQNFYDPNNQNFTFEDQFKNQS